MVGYSTVYLYVYSILVLTRAMIADVATNLMCIVLLTLCSKRYCCSSALAQAHYVSIIQYDSSIAVCMLLYCTRYC
jgi:hypothetical protein